MGRSILAAAALLALLPAGALAQLVDPVPADRMSVTVFTGYRVGFTENSGIELTDAQETIPVTQRREVFGSPVLGVTAHLPLIDRFSAVGSFTYNFRANGRLTQVTPDSEDLFEGQVGTMTFGKVGLAYQFGDRNPELRIRRVAAIVSAGPALVREKPAGDSDAPQGLTDAVTHWAAAFAAEALLPLGRSGLHAYLGADDYVVFWDSDTRARRLRDALEAELGEPVVVRQSSDATNMLILRAGLSYRF